MRQSLLYSPENKSISIPSWRPCQFTGAVIPSFLPSPIQHALLSPRPPETVGIDRFVVIGDSGSGDGRQAAVARWMMEAYRQTPFASVLALGDNVYESGEPEKFENAIYKPYRELFDLGVRFFPVMGNHDARTKNVLMQLKYWGAPRYYKYPLGKRGEAEMFALDTTVMAPGFDGCYRDNPRWADFVAQKQLNWLDKALAKSKAKYKVVYGHYPLYTSGMHAKDEAFMLRLRAMLEPILVRHGVTLYLAGHDHHYERSEPLNGVHHFISGAAAHRRSVSFPDANYPRAVALPRYHFMMFEITPQGLVYKTIGRNNTVLDQGVIPASKGFNA